VIGDHEGAVVGGAILGARVVGVFVKPRRGEPVIRAQNLRLVAGGGIVHDANADPASERQVLLVAAEEEEALGLGPGDLWENITTRGVAIDKLQRGTEIAVGPEVVVAVTGPCEPCSLISRVTGVPKVRLTGSRGTLAVVVAGGTVSEDDELRVLDTTTADA